MSEPSNLTLQKSTTNFLTNKSKYNFFTLTDVYKIGHTDQFPEGCTKVYSYLEARGSKEFEKCVFFGLQYILKNYLTICPTMEDYLEFIEFYRMANEGIEPSETIKNRLIALVNLGYFPLEIKAVPEGTVIELKNVLLSITNTHPDFFWLVGYVEVIILKIWSPITTASRVYKYREQNEKFWQKTVDNSKLNQSIYSVIDFGTRGNSSEESAVIHSLAFMSLFSGSDCFPVLSGAIKYYGIKLGDVNFMRTAPATEHSVMCSYGKENEIEAFKRMFELYPDRRVCIVSDTYNLWKVFTEFILELKDTIISRNHVTAFRPDSGDPFLIVTGDETKQTNTPEYLGCLKLLDNVFGHTINTKGYKVLNNVRIMYGDGMTIERYTKILKKMELLGYSAENLFIGVGSILFYANRDTMQFAIKATSVTINNEERQIKKDPITDTTKKSKMGYLKLAYNNSESSECAYFDDSVNQINLNNFIDSDDSDCSDSDDLNDPNNLTNSNNYEHLKVYATFDKVSKDEESNTLLQTVYLNGNILVDDSLYKIKEKLNKHFLMKKIKSVVCIIGNDCSGKTTICRELLKNFESGSSGIYPIERSCIPLLGYEDIKSAINPSNLDEILHMHTFEKRPSIANFIIVGDVKIPVKYLIVDANIEVLLQRSQTRPIEQRDKYESEKSLKYYKIKYREMSYYYGFPCVLNNGDNSVAKVCDKIYQKLKNYNFYQKLRLRQFDYNNKSTETINLINFSKFFEKLNRLDSLNTTNIIKKISIKQCSELEYLYYALMFEMMARNGNNHFEYVIYTGKFIYYCFDADYSEWSTSLSKIVEYYMKQIYKNDFVNEHLMSVHVSEVTKKLGMPYLFKNSTFVEEENTIKKLMDYFLQNKFHEHDLSPAHLNKLEMFIYETNNVNGVNGNN